MPEPQHHLLRYVIATCYPKILRRIRHLTLSKPYLVSLQSVTAFSFVEPHQHQEPNRAGIKSDRLLLSNFLSVAARKLRTKIPKIEEQIALVEAEQPFKLYTKETCIEFHELLCELLERFEAAVTALSSSRDPSGDVPIEESEQFKTKLVAVLLNGYALQKISRGSAIENHLKTIAPLLCDHRRAQEDMKAMPEMNDMEVNEERDDELEGVQPAVIQPDGEPMPLWKSYRDWLRLMVVHFDAAEILVAHITGPHFNHDNISIKILVSPPVGQAMLPWQTLLKDSALFPMQSACSTLDVLDYAAHPTNDGILKFLEIAVSSNPQDAWNSAKTAAKAIAKLKPDSTQAAFGCAIKKIELLGKSGLPGWHEYTAKIILNLENLKTTVPASPDHVALVCDITRAVHSLRDSAKFFADLKGPQIFKGSLHCEACLASLLAFSFDSIKVDTKYEDISEQLEVGYAVSMLSL
jgi:hypothetical protein